MTLLTFGTVAPTSRRAVAYIIDALIAAGIGIVLSIVLVIAAVMAGTDGILGVLAVGGPLVSLLLLGWFIVYTLMQGGRGSIGMRAQGLRLARADDGAALGFGRALLRNIIFWLAACIVVGYFTPLFDGSGRFQGWHDKVAKSVMLDARADAGTLAQPPTQAVHIPPRPQPPVPAGDAQQLRSQPQTAPPIPGLAPTPMASSESAPAPAAAPAQSWAPAQAQEHAPAPDSFFATDDPLIAFVPGVTQDAAPARTTPEAVAPEPAAPEPVAATEETQLRADAAPAPDSELQQSSDIEDTRISIPGHRLVFTWDDGTRVTVSQRTVFGRNPEPEQDAAIVPVRDETLSLSKTHFEAAAEASGGWVTDRNSTNGTVVVRDGERIACAPGERVRIRLGDAIEIGDRIVTVGGYA